MRRAVSIFSGVIFGVVAVATSRALWYAHPSWVYVASLLALIVVCWPRAQWLLSGPLIVQIAVFILGLYSAALFRGYFAWLPVRQFGFTSLLWFPIFIIALTAELFLSDSFANKLLHPASAIAAAGS